MTVTTASVSFTSRDDAPSRGAVPSTGARMPSGRSPAIREVVHLVQQVAQHDSSVLILGESGTGKEVVARAIHDSSRRRTGPFVAVNCGAIPADLLESELFGHEKGSFTGAYSTRKGRFEIAEGGTLFLDEIGDMSLPMQVKLLRVLQERVFERVGNHQPICCNVRIIAATHRNLDEAILRGQFRGDLFPIEMPSLRERLDDLDLLIGEFVEQNRAAGRSAIALTPSALAVLRRHPWPGNVRELGNLVERLSILNGGHAVDVAQLPPRYRPAALLEELALALPGLSPAPAAVQIVAGATEAPPPALLLPTLASAAVAHADANLVAEDPLDGLETLALLTAGAATDVSDLPMDGIDLRAHLFAIEHRLISQALQRSGGTVAQAARLLGLRRTTLVEKLRKFGIAGSESLSEV
jgi:sigma-54 dependent transcriptional regulator, flagellar regulatory protein